MTWSTLLITPLGFVFPDLRNQTRNFEWFVDAAWCAEIILSFLKANKTKKTLGSTSWQYLFNGRFYVGAFWFWCCFNSATNAFERRKSGNKRSTLPQILPFSRDFLPNWDGNQFYIAQLKRVLQECCGRLRQFFCVRSIICPPPCLHLDFSRKFLQ